MIPSGPSDNSVSAGNPRPWGRDYAAPPELLPVYEAARFALTQIDSVTTPLVILDRDALRAQAALWQQYLPHVTPHFAVKSNDFVAILETFRDLGMSFDAATGGEIDRLRDLKIDPKKIVCTHPIRDSRDIEAINISKPRALVVQDVAELKKLQAAGIPRAEYSPEIYVRIALPFSNLNKFGVVASRPIERDGKMTRTFDYRPIYEIFKAAHSIEAEQGVRFGGFGFAGHVGTNTTDISPYKMMIAEFLLFRRELAVRHNIQISTFDIGGGYCDPEVAEKKGTSQAELLRSLGDYTRGVLDRNPGLTLIAEPGRFMVSNAAAVVSAVKLVSDQKTKSEKDGTERLMMHKWVYFDDGLYAHLLGQAHDDKQWQFYPLRLNAGPALTAKTAPALLWGSTCDSYDKIDGLRAIPENITTGDYLIIPHAGAYTMATSTSFNRVAPPKIVAYDRALDGSFRWTLYDHVGQELSRSTDLGQATLPKV